MPTMRAADGQKLAEEHLALANRHITQAKERIARQQALIQRIAAGAQACRRICSEEMQRALDLMYEHRAHIVRELSE